MPVNGAIAVSPLIIFSQNDPRSLPAGETTPMPVTTTLRTSSRIDESLDGANDVADCAQRNRSRLIGIVGDLYAKLRFDFIDDFEQIERFDAQRVKLAIIRDFFGCSIQLFRNDLFDGFGDLHAANPRQNGIKS